MKFCSQCAGRVTRLIPADDDRPRFVCQSCGTIHYHNPIMVVGCIPEWKDDILLCRRAIEPRRGKWTLPAGYLENGETAAEGARREAEEEAGAAMGELTPFALLNITHVRQIYLMFRAPLLDLNFKAGKESLEAALFGEAEIPWGKVAFPVIEETLRLYFKDREKGRFRFHMGDIQRPPG